MPTNEERREVAARLRNWESLRETFRESPICAALDVLNVEGYLDWRGVCELLADLIEPEPEHICMDVNEAWSDFGANVFNDNALDDFSKFEKVYFICQEIAEPIKFTCEVESFDNGLDEDYDGSLYSYAPPTYCLSCGHEAYECRPSYCPVCGAKVIEK